MAPRSAEGPPLIGSSNSDPCHTSMPQDSGFTSREGRELPCKRLTGLMIGQRARSDSNGRPADSKSDVLSGRAGRPSGRKEGKIGSLRVKSGHRFCHIYVTLFALRGPERGERAFCAWHNSMTHKNVALRLSGPNSPINTKGQRPFGKLALMLNGLVRDQLLYIIDAYLYFATGSTP
jgi:hypothetical protein